VPDVHDRLEVVAVSGFQHCEVGGATDIGVRFENDAGKIELAEHFAEEEAGGPAVEVAEQADGLEQAAGERRPAPASGTSQCIEPLICPGG